MAREHLDRCCNLVDRIRLHSKRNLEDHSLEELLDPDARTTVRVAEDNHHDCHTSRCAGQGSPPSFGRRLS